MSTPKTNNPNIQSNIKNTQSESTISKAKEILEEKIEDDQKWFNDIYDPKSLNDEDLKTIWDQLSYKGFNRAEVLKQMRLLKLDKRTILELVVAGALRGPQAGSKLKLSNGKNALELGIPASGHKGDKILTLNKIVSATADLAAFYLKRFNAPKRMNLELPGWLQFPSAGSIRMPEKYRQLHFDFAKSFSTLIGGVFQEQIYMQMQMNAYLDEDLRLFDG
jgi:hypothetical protein